MVQNILSVLFAVLEAAYSVRILCKKPHKNSVLLPEEGEYINF